MECNDYTLDGRKFVTQEEVYYRPFNDSRFAAVRAFYRKNRKSNFASFFCEASDLISQAFAGALD